MPINQYHSCYKKSSLKKIHFICFILPFILWSFHKTPFPSNNTQTTISPQNHKIKGMTVVTAQQTISCETILSLEEIGVNTITLLPFGFFKGKAPEITFESVCRFPNCPFGEHTHTVLKESIDQIHDSGLQVMIKPHLWSFNQWSSRIDFKNEADWMRFETAYRDFIMTWVDIAVAKEVEFICIGSELHNFVAERPAFWVQLIQEIRTKYNGKLTYGANWSDYHINTLWDKLDYIGVNTYFPLSADTTPTVQHLEEKWQPIVHQLDSISTAWNKPILFTEWGYLSVDACAYEHWKIRINKVKANQQAQANATAALLHTFSTKEWWAGGAQWKWYNDSISTTCEYRTANDYTPQNKITLKVLKEHYQ